MCLLCIKNRALPKKMKRKIKKERIIDCKKCRYYKFALDTGEILFLYRCQMCDKYIENVKKLGKPYSKKVDYDKIAEMWFKQGRR